MKFPDDPQEEELYTRALEGDFIELIGEPDQTEFWCYLVTDRDSLAIVREWLVLGFVEVLRFMVSDEAHAMWDELHRRLYDDHLEEDCPIADY